MATQNMRASGSSAATSTVDPAEIAKFSKLSEEWWNPRGKMAPLHKINPLRLAYIRDAAARKFERNVKSLNCLAGLRVLDIGCGAGLLCEPLARLGAQMIGVDPAASNIAAARLHADRGHLSIDYRCTTIEEMDSRERFDIVLAMEVVEHVADVGLFLTNADVAADDGVRRPGDLLLEILEFLLRSRAGIRRRLRYGLLFLREIGAQLVVLRLCDRAVGFEHAQKLGVDAVGQGGRTENGEHEPAACAGNGFPHDCLPIGFSLPATMRRARQCRRTV